ncbi:uncharacterized protein LOC115623524 [Scaptodrosophila lebanonensis]|uniref:Uncharacterized protein LOC115623524 n=1 Tax=Drosophila lebanonensis TaxID=7225 RepID=A0A6J2TFJ2_DROLE|nr:uncharacterized protein LOC115623524 [Scaptodrosophila lebanonensis]
MRALLIGTALLCGLCLHNISPATAAKFSWSCYANAKDFPIDLEKMAGYWYEAARVPNVDVLECLNVSVPATVSSSDKLDLELSYISTVNGKWLPTHEVISFPANSLENGNFVLQFSSSTLNVTVVYKLVYTDYSTVALLCGYASISPVPLFKLFTRQREINPAYKKLIEDKASNYSLLSQVYWEEQSVDSCNGGWRTVQLSEITWHLSVVLLLWQLASQFFKTIKL